MSSSVISRCTRSISVPIFRASMNSTGRGGRGTAVLLVAGQEPQAHGDLRRVEELPGQRDHAVHQVGLDDRLADLALARLVRRHRAVGQHEPGQARRAPSLEEVLHPGEVGVARGRHAECPALVVLEQLAAPVRVVERRVGDDEVGLQVGWLVVVERVAVADLGVDPADGEVHLGQPPGRVVGLLPVDRDVADACRRGASMNFSLLTNMPPSRSRGRRCGPCTGRASRPAA
jgi:hypothetical protein